MLEVLWNQILLGFFFRFFEITVDTYLCKYLHMNPTKRTDAKKNTKETLSLARHVRFVGYPFGNSKKYTSIHGI